MSLDDFYLLGSGLLMTQTSIGVFNVSLFTQLSPHSLLAWQRVRLANSLAHSGEEWAHIFSRYNSGEVLLMGEKTRGLRGFFSFYSKPKLKKHLLHTFRILKHGLCLLNWAESVGVLYKPLNPSSCVSRRHDENGGVVLPLLNSPFFAWANLLMIPFKL